jgi:methionine aminotransferase
VHPGDEVILIDPAYDSYAPIVKLCGARAIRVPLTLDGFAVDWQRVGEAMSDKTKLLVINNPHNPTGSCWRSEDLDQLEDLVERWPMWVLADEVYEHMVFDQHTHQSLHLRESLAQRSIIVASFGKTYHMTGWKIGYCVAPKYLTTEIRKIHQFVTFAISHPMQLALADFLEAHPEWDEQLSGFYQAKRDRMITALAGSAFKCTPTPSTYFQVVDYSDITNIDDTHFVRQLITKWGVASIPLSVFYEKPNHAKRIRLCFAKSDEVIDQACARLSQISAGAF